MLYYSPRVIGHSFEEVVGSELITPPENLKCRWFHSPYDCDFILWKDNNDIYVRLHVCVSGLTLDWDLMNGTQSGCIVEKSDENLTHSIFGEIEYDSEISTQTCSQILGILAEMNALPQSEREEILEYFQKSPTYSKLGAPESGYFWKDFVGLLRKFFGGKSE